MVKVVSWLHTDEGRQRKGRERITRKSQTGLALGVQTRCRAENKIPTVATGVSNSVWTFQDRILHVCSLNYYI